MLKMIDPNMALQLVTENCLDAKKTKLPLNKILGMTLAQEIRADRDYPPFPRAMMDGYAVKTTDAGKTVVCLGIQAAGQVSTVEVKPGTCLEIMTGAACPESADLVVPVENVLVEDGKISLPTDLKAGANIASKGQECKRSRIVAGAGDQVTPLIIANLACFGYQEVEVYRKPEMLLISTGDELLRPGDSVNQAQIRDSNGPMLEAMAREAGIEIFDHRHALDNLESLSAVITASTQYDIVVLSGGVSMGKFDLVPAALQQAGVDVVFHKSTQKPGKPLLFGRRGKQLFFGLPGNPLASHMCFHRYISPSIRIISGKNHKTTREKGRISENVARKGERTFFQLVSIKRGEGELYQVTPLKGEGSADIYMAAKAQAYLILDEKNPEYKKNDIVEFEFTGERRWQS